MSFVDEIKIFLKAGRGGDGVVRWRHEKYKEFAGPAGGDGGRGGDVYLEAVRDVDHLERYSQFHQLQAEDGEPGGSDSRTGRGGRDLVMTVPVGSRVSNTLTGEEFDLTEEGQKVMILKGGDGGFGNERFKSSRNTTPLESSEGQEGEGGEFYIDLLLIADVGLIGLPNAGKSTLLNELTNAKSRVGGYPFTTLEPHLGEMYGYVLADIPGLIEGASDGRGLGYEFLRHIKRTSILVHCLSLEAEGLKNNYLTVRRELESFDRELLNKPEMIVLTKIDTVDQATVAQARRDLAEFDQSITAVSILEDLSIKDLRDKLTAFLRQSREPGEEAE